MANAPVSFAAGVQGNYLAVLDVAGGDVIGEAVIEALFHVEAEIGPGGDGAEVD